MDTKRLALNLRALTTRLTLFCCVALFCASCATGGELDQNLEIEEHEVVVLVHGLGRTELSMVSIGWALERQGYRVVNWGYSSTCCSLAEIGAQLAQDLDELEGPTPTRIHFVGHSLGNIVVRWVLTHAPPEQPGRVVMLAPPNQGSKIADRYSDAFGWLLLPLDDLMTEEASAVRSLPNDATTREVGIIAGEYDGKVTVEETRWKAAKAHIVVPSAHTFIMNRGDVHRLALSFLKNGRFD